VKLDIEHLDKAALEKFFKNHDEYESIIDDMLSSNSLNAFKQTMGKYGLEKVLSACTMPSSPRIDESKIFRTLTNRFFGDFI